ncbi:hypothetical protein BDN70DRAFT_995176 [Pholiota conissans]|uniref:CFEM domain-containing protein n=1 Tax=Pholiota conissans TaxID=109636 RepID=A0A9P5YYR6_9AGAR|nr:hypothetical protein BDN70DRAFT_995176 [Pholiota conissans]
MFPNTILSILANTIASLLVVAAQESTTSTTIITHGPTVTTSAQNPNATVFGHGVPLRPCMLDCYIPAATLNGCDFTDASCVCASVQFAADVSACVNTHCAISDLTDLADVQAFQCVINQSLVLPNGLASTTNIVPFKSLTLNLTNIVTGTDTDIGPTPTPPITVIPISTSTSPSTADTTTSLSDSGSSTITSLTTSTSTSGASVPTTTTSSRSSKSVVLNMAFVVVAVSFGGLVMVL